MGSIKVVVDTHLLCQHQSYKDDATDIKDTMTFMLLTKFQKVKHGLQQCRQSDRGIEVQRDSLSNHAAWMI